MKSSRSTEPQRRLPRQEKAPRSWMTWREVLGSLGGGIDTAELGVYGGASSAEILEVVCPRSHVMVDLWKPYGTPRIKALEPQSRWDARYRACQSRFHEEINDGTVEILRASFAEAAAHCADRRFDLIHHNGDSKGSVVLDTLRQWWPLLKVGGVWIQRDFVVQLDNGTQQAVVQFLREQADAEWLGTTRLDLRPLCVLRKDDGAPSVCRACGKEAARVDMFRSLSRTLVCWRCVEHVGEGAT